MASTFFLHVDQNSNFNALSWTQRAAQGLNPDSLRIKHDTWREKKWFNSAWDALDSHSDSADYICKCFCFLAICCVQMMWSSDSHIILLRNIQPEVLFLSLPQIKWLVD